MVKQGLVALCVALWMSVTHANTLHQYPNSTPAPKINQASPLNMPGFCEIEVINATRGRIRVYGVFDDGVPMHPFEIYPRDYPHYIDLFYYGYCHSMMTIYIDDAYGYHLYGGNTAVGSSLYVADGWFGQRPRVTAKTR